MKETVIWWELLLKLATYGKRKDFQDFHLEGKVHFIEAKNIIFMHLQNLMHYY